MPQDYTIQATGGRDAYTTADGTEFVDYELTIVDQNTGQVQDVILTQIPKTRPPVTGDVIYGHTETVRNKLKLRKDKKTQSTPQRANFQTQGSKPDEAYWDEQNAQKRRCHSQEMAIRWLSLQHGADKTLVELTKDELTKEVDWFDRDVTHRGKTTVDESVAGTPEARALATKTGGEIVLSDTEIRSIWDQAVKAGLPKEAWLAKLAELQIKDLGDFTESKADAVFAWIQTAKDNAVPGL